MIGETNPPECFRPERLQIAQYRRLRLRIRLPVACRSLRPSLQGEGLMRPPRRMRRDPGLRHRRFVSRIRVHRAWLPPEINFPKRKRPAPRFGERAFVVRYAFRPLRPFPHRGKEKVVAKPKNDPMNHEAVIFAYREAQCQ